MNNRLSIIVTVYNKEKYLKKCLDSLLFCAIEGTEIIIVDDGSTDNSGFICDDYKMNVSNVKVIHKENGGLIAARLTGVENAQGEWIGFVDADDYIEKEMFLELMNVCAKSNCDLVSSGIIRNFEYGNQSEVIFDNFEEGLYTNLNENIYKTMLFDFNENDFGLYSTLVNKLFKKDILINILNDVDKMITYGEDAAILYSYCMECDSIYILHKAFYHYCMRNGSMCSTKNLDLINNTYRIYKSLECRFRNSEKKHILMKQLKRYVIELETHTFELIYGINHGLLNKWTFTYSEDIKHKRIIIYGAAACGQALYHHLCKIGCESNIVSWVDKNYIDLSEQCDYALESVEEGLKKKYDLIIIGVKKKSLSEIIRTSLITEYGVDDKKIIWEQSMEESFFSEALC